MRANSRLALIAVLGGTVAAPFAAAILKVSSAAWVLRFGAVIFVVGIFAALAIPRAKEVGPPETEAHASSCMCASIVTAGSAMGSMRGVVGFHDVLRRVRAQEAGRAGMGLRARLVGGAIGNATGT